MVPRCYPRRPRAPVRSPVFGDFLVDAGLGGTRLFSLPSLLLLRSASLFLLHSIYSLCAGFVMLVLIMLALLLTDFILGCIFWPRLKIKRILPDRVCAGQPFQIQYFLENRRRLPAFSLVLDAGLGVHWFRCLQAPALKILGEGEKHTIHVSFLAKQRGKYSWAMQRRTSDSRCNLPALEHSQIPSTDRASALPQLQELHLPSGVKLQKSGLERVMKVSEAMEFQGCRDYREGDNPRHIHWRSSARRGDLVVREFQDEYLSRTALIVDTCLRRPKRKPSLFRAIKKILDFFKGKGMLWPDGIVRNWRRRSSLAARLRNSAQGNA